MSLNMLVFFWMASLKQYIEIWSQELCASIKIKDFNFGKLLFIIDLYHYSNIVNNVFVVTMINSLFYNFECTYVECRCVKEKIMCLGQSDHSWHVTSVQYCTMIALRIHYNIHKYQVKIWCFSWAQPYNDATLISIKFKNLKMPLKYFIF